MPTSRSPSPLGMHRPPSSPGFLAAPRPAVLAAMHGAIAQTRRDDLDLVLNGPDQRLLLRTDENDAAVARWICAAVCSRRGEMYLMGLRQLWAKRFQKMNVNLVAAERFMGAYEGSLGTIALAFQYAGKYFRESDAAEVGRAIAPDSAWKHPNFVMLFGRNGTPANTVDFTTRWALSGLGHRDMKLPPGGSAKVGDNTVASPFQCHCCPG